MDDHIRKLHNAMDNVYWEEPTEPENYSQNRRLIFHQPASGIDGTYRFEHTVNGQKRIKDGKYEIVNEGQDLYLILDDKVRYTVLFNDEKMTWSSDDKNERVFHKVKLR